MVKTPSQDRAPPPPLFDRAVEHHQAGRLTEAARLYDEVLQQDGNHFDALHMLAVVRHQQGRNAEAMELISRALTLKPNSAYALSNGGLVLQALRRYDEALASFDKALAVDPDDIAALNNRGNVLREMARYEEALASYDGVLVRAPDYAAALNNRGNALHDLKRYEEAIASYDKALAREPAYGRALYNRGTALQALNRHAEAVTSYQQALALDPDNADVHWNESAARLALGDFREGWKKFEWRWKTSDSRAASRRFPQPLWLGESSLAGKTILLHAEQGLGDVLQFVRYVPLVAAKGAKVLLAVHSELQPLLAGMEGAAAVFAENETLPAFDVQCPLLSLPLAFGTTLETIPADVPYLRAPADRIAHWRQRFAATPGLRVGLAWSGSPAHKNNRARSLALAQLAPLLSVPGVAFVSLHRGKDLPAGDADNRVVSLGPDAPNFVDAAAIISCLDLVISVDTSLAHLAGALGKPLWILLAYSPDWRWMLGRDDSPWYPTARLFRQPRIDDWQSVVARAAAELNQLNAAKSSG